jgi:Domain of unknown function (DUF1905)
MGAASGVEFRSTIRRWSGDKPGGLAVVDVPAELVDQLGGRRQMRVTGTLRGAPFTGIAPAFTKASTRKTVGSIIAAIMSNQAAMNAVSPPNGLSDSKTFSWEARCARPVACSTRIVAHAAAAIPAVSGIAAVGRPMAGLARKVRAVQLVKQYESLDASPL